MEVQKTDKQILEEVLSRVQELEQLGQIELPKDYNSGNALRSAWLALQDIKTNGQPLLSTVTRTSVAQALMQMVLEGLSMAKSQGSFVPYGNRLTWQREYAGNMVLAKRNGMKEVHANVIYTGDIFQFEVLENGRKVIRQHVQGLENIKPENMIGAYCVVTMNDGSNYAEVMTVDMIRNAWAMAPKLTKAHTMFPDQMAMKTVINRGLKYLVNSAMDDGPLDEYQDAMAAPVANVVPVAGVSLDIAPLTDVQDIKTPF